MRRRAGQSGTVVRKGNQWHIRFYADVEEGRKRKSLPVGPAKGKGRLTKAEAQRKGAELIEKLGINREAHLARAQHPEAIETFKQRVEWCRLNHPAWTDGKKGPIATMESQLSKHILPAFGSLPVQSIDERVILEFVAGLKRTQFERKRKNGDLLKTYTLSRKTIANVLGIVKTIVGRKVYSNWEINLGKPSRPQQRYFREEDIRRIVEAAPGKFKVLFAVLATGMRIGEALGLHIGDVDLEERVITIRRSIYRGLEQTPKTENAIRQVDIGETLATMLKNFIGKRKTGYVFESRTGTPLSDTNIRNRILRPLLKQLGIKPAGLHAFRHGAVTMHRKAGTPENLLRMWIGHSSLGRITDRYSHTDQEVEYRRANVLPLDRVIRGR